MTEAPEVPAPALPEAPVVIPSQDEAEIVQRLVVNTAVVSLTKRRPGTSRQAKLDDARFVPEGDTESKEPSKALLRLTKTILSSPELKAVAKFDNKTTSIITDTYAFPAPEFKPGMFRVSLAQTVELNEILKQRTEERKVLVQAAVDKYEQRCQETSVALGILHEEGEYPPKEDFAAAFDFTYSIGAWDTPNRIKAVSQAVFDQEKEKARGFMRAVAEHGRIQMRAMLLKMLDNLKDALAPDFDGKKKRLSKANIDNLNDFLSTFASRNVTGDGELNEIVRQTQSVMLGLDKDMLKDEGIRERVERDLDTISANLTVIAGGQRKMTFDAEEI